MWSSISDHMSLLAELKSEEKQWQQALATCEERERLLEEGKVEEEEQSLVEEVMGDSSMDDIDMESDQVTQVVNDTCISITLAADRIAQTMRGIKQLVKESELVKEDLANKRNEVMGTSQYPLVNDPKALIRGILN